VRRAGGGGRDERRGTWFIFRDHHGVHAFHVWVTPSNIDPAPPLHSFSPSPPKNNEGRKNNMLTMALLLTSAAVARGLRAASFTLSLPAPRRAVSSGIASSASPNPRRHVQPRFLAATLQRDDNDASFDGGNSRRSFDDDDDDDDGDFPSGTTSERRQKSRKQRRRETEDKNLTRIDKLLAHRGVGTRSETFDLAKARRVSYASHPNASHEERVRIRGPREKVPFDASLFLDGNLLPGPPPLLLVYHKPKFVLSVMEDDVKYRDQARRHLGMVLEERYKKGGMHPVGRLDYDTTGLILFSLDGKLTQKLLHPRRGVEKEYLATVRGIVDGGGLADKLSVGVETTEGVHRAKLISVCPSDGPPVATAGEFEEGANVRTATTDGADDGDGNDDGWRDDYSGPYSDVRLVVSEGKHRMVRRMLANCGHPVVELRRLRHGGVELGDLKVGEFRHATREELEWARSLID
jgi:pseudouridine synthase